MTHRPSLVLYPTRRRLADAVARRMGGDGETGAFSFGEMTFGDFEERLAESLLPDVGELSQQGRGLLLATLISGEKLLAPDGALQRLAATKGFVPSILSLFDELGAGIVSPDQLNLLTGWADDKEADVARLYDAYHRRLNDLGLTDAGARRRGVVEALAAGSPPLAETFLARFSAVEVVDIYQYTPYRYELLRLIGRSMPVIIHTPVPDRRSKAFGFLVRNMIKFESLAGSEGRLEILPREAEPGPLDWLTESLFTIPASGAATIPTADERAKQVRLVRAPSRYREIEEIAAEIVRLRDEEGVLPGRVGLILRDVGPYLAIIRDVFDRYRLPYTARHGAPVTSTPAGRAVASIFTAVDSRFGREPVIRLMASPYFARYRDVAIDRLRTLALGARLREGESRQWNELLTGHHERLDKKREGDKELIGAAVELVEKLALFAGQTAPAPFLASLAELLEWLGFTGADDDEAISDRLRFRDRDAAEKVAETLASMTTLTNRLKLTNRPLTFNVMADLFLAALAERETPEPTGGTDRDRVAVVSVHDAVGANWRRVFMAGLHEKEFPRFHAARSILTEEERESFNKRHDETVADPRQRRGRRVFDRAYDKWQEESLLFFQGVMAADEGIVFSWSVRELDGRPLARSQFVDDLLDAVAPDALDSLAREERIDSPAPLALLTAGEPTDREAFTAAVLRGLFEPDDEKRRNAEEALGQLAVDRAEWDHFVRLVALADRERYRDRLFAEPNRETRRALSDRFNGDLTDGVDELSEWMQKRLGTYAPTDLEKYGQCPFRYLAGKVWGLEKVEEPTGELDNKETGTLAHAALERFYARRIADGAKALTGGDEEREALRKALADEAEVLRRKGIAGDPAIFDVEVARLAGYLVRWLHHDTLYQRSEGYTPVGVEVPYDLPERAAKKGTPEERRADPLELALPCGGLRYLTGSADRVDINRAANAFRVIDYKTGSGDAKYKKLLKPEAMGVTSFQAPVYMGLTRPWVIKRGFLNRVDEMSAAYGLLRMKIDGKKSAVVASLPTSPIFWEKRGANKRRRSLTPSPP